MNLKLYKLRLEEVGKLVEHMHEFNGILSQIKQNDVKIEQKVKTLMILTLMPDSHNNYKKELLYGEDIITIEEASASVLSRESLVKANGEVGRGDESLITQGRGQKGRSFNKGGSKHVRHRYRVRTLDDVKCFRCK